MNTVGIIAEYNPLHIGHASHLARIARTWPSALRIVVMSGAFVQRGLPAFFDKMLRASAALSAGADIVIELPVAFSVRSAEHFAGGGIRMLAALGIDAFSFGSEITNVDTLSDIAALLSNEAVVARQMDFLRQGLSYGTALREALTEAHPEALAVVTSSNALLGIEYIRAVNKYNLDLIPLPVSRDGNHKSLLLGDASPSGTALRDALSRYKDADTPEAKCAVLQSAAPYIPEPVLPLVERALNEGAFSSLSRYYDLIRFAGLTGTPQRLERYGNFSEGLENRWLKAADYPTWSEGRRFLKSKRYSYARLDRMATYTVLGLTKECLTAATESGPLYARLLGCSDAGRDWLRYNDASIPIIQKWAPFVKSSEGLTKRLAVADTLATDIQRMTFVSPSARRGKTDFTSSPLFP